jgi:hypothetical protein
MAKPELDDAINRMANMWDSETDEFRSLVWGILARLSGRVAEPPEPYDRLSIGWLEADMLGRILVAAETPEDVETVAAALGLLKAQGEEEEDR